MSRQETPAQFYGYYINLDRSNARRERFDAQLARFGLSARYSRIPAIDGRTAKLPASKVTPGEGGCFLSHCRALEEGRTRGTPVHILEDDAVLSAHTAPVIEDAIAARLFDRVDILFTDSLFQCHLGMLKSLKAAFDRIKLPEAGPAKLADLQLLDLSQQSFSCLTSYVVAPRAIDRLLAMMRQEIAAGPRTPADLFVRDAVHAGKLRAACVFPFVTSFDLDEVARSTIGEGGEAPAKPSVMVLAVLRNSFFLGGDLDNAKRHLDAATKKGRKPTNAHHDLIVQALEFVVSDDFQEF